VVKAILLDYEARSSSAATEPRFGKQREPLLRVTAAARAFPGPAPLDATYSQDGGRPIRLVTATPHRLNSGDTVKLTFTDGSGQPVPPAQGYSVTVTNPSVFTVNAPGVTTGTYGQTNQVITVNLGSHGLATNYWVYLVFTSGSATNGVYRVVTVPDASHFTVATLSPTLTYGNCLFPRLTGGGYVQSGNTVTFSLPYSPRLSVGDQVYINFTQSGSPADGTYTITAVPDATHFSITAANSATLTQNGAIVYPLTVPPLVRSGTARIEWSTWSMNTTDTGSSSSLSQSPLNSPTVFNFYFPDYKFPGALAAAGLTTPEFQITSDTTTAQQMNFLAGGILGNASNTNGLTSFASGNGAIVLDIKPYMTTGYTSNAGVPSLVDALNTLLCAGQLSGGAKEKIVSYVANTSNFPLSAIPTQTQMRERVRAVIHLIVISPEYTIQR